ncbi:MAG: hypothetical protein M1162_02175 [Candidatus Thermoplasmatota archaeon]|nr:hypothetical protein [Candidatus Thermoplasmatota archaeon]
MDFDGEVKDAVFVGLPPFPGLEISVNLTGINAEESNLLIRDRMRDPRISGKALLLRVYGKISGGRTSDIDFREIRKLAITNGVAFLQLDRFSLESEEMVRYKVSGGTVQEIEKNVIMENAGNFQTSLPPLQGEKGVEMAVSLLQLLRSPRMENETESNYATRIMRDSLKTLGIELEP